MAVKVITKPKEPVEISEKEMIQKSLGVTPVPQATITMVKSGKVSKQEKGLVQSNTLTKDDEFEPFYFDIANPDKKALIRPPFNLKNLHLLCQQNNALGQLVSAMEVNIDGTGYVVEKKGEEEQTEEEDKIAEDLKSFFDEILPGVSFVTLRRIVRRDLEIIGSGYMEVLRSLDSAPVFLKHMTSSSVRLVMLDEAVDVEREVMRNGETMTVRMNVKERRFAQISGKKLVYFKEYMASRDLDKITGEWADAGSLPVEQRATEVLWLKVHEDVTSAYGVPRWINQIPSVLGSRKAEELNLDFFNSGGLPPAMIIIQGGELTEEVRKQVQQYLSGKGASIHRAAVVEVHATGGSLDSPGNVKVTVERFGAERMRDSMFENYDSKSESRVRSAFRLPPIFVGKAEDYSFATAFASYTVAEAQVFQPERQEFDEMINATIVKELRPEGDYVFRSLALNVKDVTQQLKGIELAQGALSSEGMVDAINETVNLDLKFDDSEPEPAPAPALLPAPAPAPAPASDPTASITHPAMIPAPVPVATPTPKAAMDTFEMMRTVNDWVRLISEPDPSANELRLLKQLLDIMSEPERELFDAYCTTKLMSGMEYDPEGAIELMGAASDVIGCEPLTTDV